MEAAQERLSGIVAEAPRPQATATGKALAAFAFCGSFVATCWLVAFALRSAPAGSQFDFDSISSRKHQAFAEDKDKYEVAFVGTSRVKRQFNPELFDGHLAQAGLPLDSFNFGIAGMRYPESSKTVRWILDQEPKNLKWLLIDLSAELTHVPQSLRNSKEAPELLLHLENAFSRRVIDFHDGQRTRLLCRAILASELSLRDKLDGLRVHLHQWAICFAQLGYTVRAVHRWRTPQVIKQDWAGFRASKATGKAGSPGLRKEVKESLETFVETRPATPTDPIWWADLERLTSEVRAHGVEPIFVVVPPHWHHDVAGFDPAQIAGLPAVLDYRDPQAYPQFFEARHLHNFNHLNNPGSALFVELLAEDFARLAKPAQGE